MKQKRAMSLLKTTGSVGFSVDQFDLLPLGVCVVDRELNVHAWNATLTGWTGISKADALETNLARHYPHLKSPRFQIRLRDVFQSHQPTILSPGLHGFFIPVSLKGEPGKQMIQKTFLQTFDDARQHVLVVVEDVTAQFRKIEQLRLERRRLQASEAQIRAILEAAVDPIITINGEGEIETYNPAAERLFGYATQEVIGQNVRVLVPSPHREKHDEYLQNFFLTRESEIVGIGREVIGQRKDGMKFPMYLAVSEVVVGAKGRDQNAPLAARLFTGIIRDLTEQKRAEADLLRTKESAEAANRAKSEFLANMSHEIRTPMTAILGFADILISNVTLPENIDAASTIKENGEYLLGIINDILDLSKVEAEQMKIERITCVPHAIVADVISLMRVRAAAKGLRLEARFDGPIPESIQSDPTRLRQVLVNIVGNAIKFTETGSIRVTTRLTDESAGNRKLKFEVSDTGIGISEKQMEKLFQPFTQADSSTTRRFGGTGLGLTISKRLVEMLGGEISISSTVGQGSTFSITVSTGPLDGVPLLHSDGECMAGRTSQANKKETLDDVRLDGRILLAEDGPDNQRLISFLLKKAGAEVEIAKNGAIAVEKTLAAQAAGQPFHVILMDMQMPVLDGYQASGCLREAGITTPIVALTAHAMAGDRRKCIKAGCSDYLTKPIDRQQLIATVARHAESSSPTFQVEAAASSEG